MKPTEQVRELQQAIKRLEKSSAYLSRKRALNNLRATLKSIERDLIGRYPKLRTDGSTVIVKKPKGYRCPQCGKLFKGALDYADHAMMHMRRLPVKYTPLGPGWLSYARECWCGKKFFASCSGELLDSIKYHLAHKKHDEAMVAMYLLQGASDGNG